MSMTKVNRNAELTLLYLYSCSELCLAASMLHSLCASALKKLLKTVLSLFWLWLVSHPVVLFKVNLVTLELEVSNQLPVSHLFICRYFTLHLFIRLIKPNNCYAYCIVYKVPCKYVKCITLMILWLWQLCCRWYVVCCRHA